MVNVFWWSLVIISFILTSSSARHAKALIHHDGHASRYELIHALQDVKVTKAQSTAMSASRTNGEKMTEVTGSDAKILKQEISKTIRNRITRTPREPFLEENAPDKCMIKIKVSSTAKQGSRIEACERKVRRLIPRQRDMDEFVAYADYKGPMHHPPRNN